MREAVRQVLLAGCAARDPNVRWLAVVAVFRLAHAHQALGMLVVQELARRSVRYGLIRPQRLEVFVGSALSLFFERPRDADLVRELKQMAKGVFDRVWGLRLGVWLAPKVLAVLWDAVPDDYNNVNLPEIKAYKRYAAAHPELLAAVNEMIDFIDPARASGEQLPGPRSAWTPGPYVRRPF